MKLFPVVVGPDGGFGLRNDKNSRLAVVIYGFKLDLMMARSAIAMCQDFCDRPLYLHKLLEHVHEFQVVYPSGEKSHPMINILVDKRYLLNLVPKDVANPIAELKKDLQAMETLVRTLSQMDQCLILGAPNGEAVLPFLYKFSGTLSFLLKKKPIKSCPVAMDLKEIKAYEDWEALNLSLKTIHDEYKGGICRVE